MLIVLADKYIAHSFMFEEILKTTGTYSDNDFQLFEQEVRVRHVKKNDVLLCKGDVARSIFFMLKGAARQYNIIAETEYNIIDLHLSDEWFFNLKSLVTQKPSEFFIEAFSNSSILEISLETVHYLTGKSLAFLQLNSILQGDVARLSFYDRSMTPLEKYQFILNTRPQLMQVFPLKIIASYLKITPETLSRTREKLTRNGDIS